MALNAALHQSPKSWGYVPSEDIHDTLAMNEEDKDGNGGGGNGGPIDWTFRRVGNLTAWAA